MYPEFIAEARAAGEKDAVKSFNFAVTAEGQHAKFYAEAAANLAAWKTAKKFAVCPVCGNTVTVVGLLQVPGVLHAWREVHHGRLARSGACKELL